MNSNFTKRSSLVAATKVLSMAEFIRVCSALGSVKKTKAVGNTFSLEVTTMDGFIPLPKVKALVKELNSYAEVFVTLLPCKVLADPWDQEQIENSANLAILCEAFSAMLVAQTSYVYVEAY